MRHIVQCSTGAYTRIVQYSAGVNTRIVGYSAMVCTTIVEYSGVQGSGVAGQEDEGPTVLSVLSNHLSNVISQ